MTSPIIFCHYGNSEYLPYVMQLASEKNPEKDIILLGDDSNKWLGEKFRIKHFLFADYNGGVEIELFDRVYRVVKGSRHRNMRDKVDWVNFVFKRWFYVYNFITSENIGPFWHFDSDNLILDDLSDHESKFSGSDCTEQCEGACINGFISNRSVVYRYLKHINKLFQDDAYLAKMQSDFDLFDSEYAFTEMAAYVDFKKADNPKTMRLNSFKNDESFDDCLCHEHDMLMEYYPPLGRKIKRVFFKKGCAYAIHQKSGAVVRLVSLNMSWLSLEFYKVVLENVSDQYKPWDMPPEGATLAQICQSRYNKRFLFHKYTELMKKIKKMKKWLKKKRKSIFR